MTATLADEMLADLDLETGVNCTPITFGHVQTADLTPGTRLQDIHPDAWDAILLILGYMDRGTYHDAGHTLTDITRGAHQPDETTTRTLLDYLTATGRLHLVELSRHHPACADRWFLGPNPNAAIGPAAPLDAEDPALDEDPWADRTEPRYTAEITEPAPF